MCPLCANKRYQPSRPPTRTCRTPFPNRESCWAILDLIQAIFPGSRIQGNSDVFGSARAGRSRGEGGLWGQGVCSRSSCCSRSLTLNPRCDLMPAVRFCAPSSLPVPTVFAQIMQPTPQRLWGNPVVGGLWGCFPPRANHHCSWLGLFCAWCGSGRLSAIHIGWFSRVLSGKTK